MPNLTNAASAAAGFALLVSSMSATYGLPCRALEMTSPVRLAPYAPPAIGPPAIAPKAAAAVIFPATSRVGSSLYIWVSNAAWIMPSSPASLLPSLITILTPVLASLPNLVSASPTPVPVLPKTAFSSAAPPIPMVTAVTPPATNAWRWAISIAIFSASASVFPDLKATLKASMYALDAAPPADSVMSVKMLAVIPAEVPILAATA